MLGTLKYGILMGDQKTSNLLILNLLDIITFLNCYLLILPIVLNHRIKISSETFELLIDTWFTGR